VVWVNYGVGAVDVMMDDVRVRAASSNLAWMYQLVEGLRSNATVTVTCHTIVADVTVQRYWEYLHGRWGSGR
jgi:hypothetical protein